MRHHEAVEALGVKRALELPLAKEVIHASAILSSSETRESHLLSRVWNNARPFDKLGAGSGAPSIRPRARSRVPQVSRFSKPGEREPRTSELRHRDRAWRLLARPIDVVMTGAMRHRIRPNIISVRPRR